MAFVPFLVLASLNKKVVDWCKELLPNNLLNRWVQIIAFGVGVAFAFLFAHSNFGDGIDVWSGLTLAKLNALGIVVYGLAIGAGGGVLNDAIERRNPDADPDPPVTLGRRPPP